MAWLDYVTHSEIGLVRKNNQDSGYASPDMLLVADGMGGAAAGDLASAVAVDELRLADELQRADVAAGEPALTGDEMLDVLELTLAKANDRLAELVAQDHDLEGMGTTVCGAFFDGDRLGIVHIGDSRGYILRDGELVRLTRDHSWVQSLVDDGKISEEEALYHPHRSLLLRVLNGQPTNVPDLLLVDVQPGDRILFCSDGLCGLVEDGPIGDALRTHNLDDTLGHLVKLAHEGGGLDNITLVLADVREGEPETALEPVTIGAAAEIDIPQLTTHAPFTLDDRDAASSEGADVHEVVVPAIDSDDIPASPRTPSEAEPSRFDSPRRNERTVTLVADAEDARYRPLPPPRRRKGRWLAVVAALLALILAIAFGADRIIRSQYFLGESNRRVVVYNGVPGQLGMLNLSREAEATPVFLDDLPKRLQSQVRNHEFRSWSLDDSRRSVSYLTDEAKRCRDLRNRPPSPTPSATPSPAPTNPTAPTPATPVVPTTGPTVVVSPTVVGPTVVGPTAVVSPTVGTPTEQNPTTTVAPSAPASAQPTPTAPVEC